MKKDKLFGVLYLRLILGYRCVFTFITFYFQESIKTQGTVEQWEHWKPLIEQMRVIGCFCNDGIGTFVIINGIRNYGNLHPFYSYFSY